MKNFVFIIGIISLFAMAGCENRPPSSNEALASKQEEIMNEANRQVGMPAIKNFQERKLLKTVLELRDQEDLICYAYLWNEYNGKLVFIGKCIGYGIPYATEYTNPQSLQKCNAYGGDYSWEVLPQADPNGLFMPGAAEGTWLMMLDDKSEPHPVYIEPRVIVSPFKLTN